MNKLKVYTISCYREENSRKRPHADDVTFTHRNSQLFVEWKQAMRPIPHQQFIAVSAFERLWVSKLTLTTSAKVPRIIYPILSMNVAGTSNSRRWDRTSYRYFQRRHYRRQISRSIFLAAFRVHLQFQIEYMLGNASFQLREQKWLKDKFLKSLLVIFLCEKPFSRYFHREVVSRLAVRRSLLCGRLEVLTWLVGTAQPTHLVQRTHRDEGGEVLTVKEERREWTHQNAGGRTRA